MLVVGEKLTWVVQFHDAEKAGPHYDVRIGDRERGLFSWAVPKGLPTEGDNGRLAIEETVHPFDWKDFEGEIKEGRGKGTVKKVEEGTATVIKTSKSGFTVEVNTATRVSGYIFINTKKNWLIRHKGPTDENLSESNGRSKDTNTHTGSV